jgi:hypothetical protein
MFNKDKKIRKRLKFRDNDGNLVGSLDRIDIVTEPATELDFELFSNKDVENLETMKFSVINEDQMIFAGPAMVPNLGLPRKDKATGEVYEGYFTEEDIDDAVMLYHQYGKMNETAFEHKEFAITDEIFLLHDWRILDPKNDTANAMGYDTSKLEPKTWFVMFKCTNREMWAKLKESKFKGFSVKSIVIIDQTTNENMSALLMDDLKISQGVEDSELKEEDIKEIEQAIDSGVNIKNKNSLLYSIMKDILSTDRLNKESKQRLISRILNKI